MSSSSLFLTWFSIMWWKSETIHNMPARSHPYRLWLFSTGQLNERPNLMYRFHNELRIKEGPQTAGNKPGNQSSEITPRFN
jgi:hypothetical protein